MKIWERIYLVVIALFLVVLNVCNVLVFRSSYQKSVDSVKQMAESYWKRIAVPMAEDLAETGPDEAAQWQLFQSYVSNNSIRDCAFELWRDGKLCACSEMGSQATYFSGEGKLESGFVNGGAGQDELPETKKQTGQIVILVREGKKYTCALGELGGTGYQLVIYENVTEILGIWEKQIITFIWLEAAASLVMAVLLYLLIKKFLQPVSGISEMTAKIAVGDYTCRLEAKGTDELSGLARDINHMAEQVRENVENKEAEARHKQEFIDALSHELRTPLTSVRGYAELVRNTDASREKQLEYMDHIVKESGRMIRITETLRQVILLQMDEIEQDKISLQEFALWLREEARHQLAEKQIHWEIQAEDGEIMGNRVLTEMFFMNLMKNSFHACKEGGTVSIRLDCTKAVITDDGIGMTKECQEHIFEPFYREDKSRSRRLGGTGLGMYLCRYIADKHHWKIKIDSRKGVGTKIEVSFTSY
ncbi:MAG: HAMP domain-containing histidine kinase [Roseburia sp.]|nr:HAMP domain-containing histidine kinase [Roseburia sp.]